MTTYARKNNPLGSDRSAQPMPGQSQRAQAALAPKQHTQFTRAKPATPSSSVMYWPGTSIKRSTGNAFDRARRVTAPAPVAAPEKPKRSPAHIAADKLRREASLKQQAAARLAKLLETPKGAIVIAKRKK